MATEALYLRADEIRVGDILPDVSRTPVVEYSRDLDAPDSPVHMTFANLFTRTARYGGVEYGYECFRVERVAVESEECGHNDQGLTADRLVECFDCGRVL